MTRARFFPLLKVAGVIVLLTMACLAGVTLSDQARGDGPVPGTMAAGGTGSDVEVSTCLGLSIPTGETSVNVTFDLEAHLATFEWLEPNQEERSVTVLYLDPTCQANPSVSSYVNEGLAAHASHLNDYCSDLRAILSGQAPPDKEEFDRSAAQRYVSVRCPQ